jgi:hypothetical protein
MDRTFRRIAVAILASVSLFALSCGSSSTNNTSSFKAALNAAAETSGSTSMANGMGTFSLATDGVTFTYTVTSNVMNATAAHIHKAPAGMAGNPVFTLTGANGNYSGTQTLTADQVADLKAGNWYVNIHSMMFMDGEIRGQLGAQ